MYKLALLMTVLSLFGIWLAYEITRVIIYLIERK